SSLRCSWSSQTLSSLHRPRPPPPFFPTDTPTTETYTLSLHDALPICGGRAHQRELAGAVCREAHVAHHDDRRDRPGEHPQQQGREDGLLHEIHVQQGEGVRPPLAGVKLAHRTIPFPSTSMPFTSVWYSSERVSVFMTSATVPCRCPCGVM